MANDKNVQEVIKDGKVDITVNDKPVLLEDSKQTGESIKKAAIEQGVRIQADFVLSIERGGGKTEIIGDNDVIHVQTGDRFVVIADDDNS